MEKTITLDINENRHRYYFTREATQQEMQAKYGVTIKTIGKYYPNRLLATPSCPPLAIQLKGLEQSVDVAALFVNKVLEEGPPTLHTQQSQYQPSSTTTQSFNPQYTTKMYLGFQPHPSHVAAVRQCILGGQQSASNLAYISKTAGLAVFVALRGQGSGHIEPGMTVEQLNDAMHILIQCSTEKELEIAKTLAEDLLLVVQHEYERQFTATATATTTTQ